MTTWLRRWWSRLFRGEEDARGKQNAAAASVAQPHLREREQAGVRMEMAAGVALPLTSAAAAASPEYPRGFTLSPTGGRSIFDPALKSHPNAFREGDPPFASDADRLRWETARLALVDHMIRVVSGSEWNDRLMLRGSTLLKQWLGADARMPKDIDWVVLAQDWTADGDEADAMLEDIVRRFTAAGRVGDVALDPSQVVRDPIWTYERADGVRLTFAGHIDRLPPVKLQCDFVFGEVLWQAPVVAMLSTASGVDVRVLTASPELSLAWKLMWLLTDLYPQGKDLYDAVLLAERHALPPDLIHRVVSAVLADGGAWWASLTPAPRVEELFSSQLGRVAWADFVSEYPGVGEQPAAWVERLQRALPSLWDARTWQG